uniref:Importin N-terminal domain-containing protein n=1 Tax=Macrostomum lignano TaxID=282301 RepID=A0A1I8GGS0_9PLAT
MSIVTVLENSLSQDKAQRETALNFLQDAANQNLVQFLRQLSEILRDVNNTTFVRMQAGLQLKNQLYSKNSSVRMQLGQQWLTIPEADRSYIKENCLLTLGTEVQSSAAQAVAYIAVIELPAGQWANLMQVLVANVVDQASTPLKKQATLQAIGYICQDIDPNFLSAQSNEILTAIVNGMKKEEQNSNVRLAATQALLNSLEFTKQNFDIDAERHYIMQVVCEATQCAETGIKVAALQCLVKIMNLYYQYMETYMNQALFAGIEFWSTVCEEEIDLAIDEQESEEKGLPPTVSSKHYARGALPYLVPILTATLTRQEEQDDEDDWGPCKAATVCLMLLAQCAGDAIVGAVLPFVNDHIRSENWRFRDAAVMSFGCILEGPDPDNLRSLVENALPVIIELLRDPSNVVRDTSAWTIGRVLDTLPGLVVQEKFLNPLLHGLVEGLGAEPRVAANVCWAFSSLASAAYDQAVSQAGTSDNRSAQVETYCLSGFFEPIVGKLLETTDRQEAGQHNLRNAAYHALMEMLKHSPRDCYATLQKTTLIDVADKLQTSHDRAQLNELQSMLCATLQSVLHKIDRNDAPNIADAVMELLLRMLTQQQVQQHQPADDEAEQQSGVQEDALLAMAALVDCLGEDFIKYMEVFKPVLLSCLRSVTETQICMNAVGLLGDLCRALGERIAPYTDEIFVILVELLSSQAVDQSVKPSVISAFSDFSLALGPGFFKFLEIVINTLQQASQAQVDVSNPDQVDYLNELREACLEAYTGIVQGLKGNGPTPHTQELRSIQPAVQPMLHFIAMVARDPVSTDEVLGCACGLLGDLVTAYGADLLPAVSEDVFSAMLQKCRRSKVSKAKTLAVWTTKEIRKLKNLQTA